MPTLSDVLARYGVSNRTISSIEPHRDDHGLWRIKFGGPGDIGSVNAAVRVEDTLIATYLGPNRTLKETFEYAHSGGLNVLTEFGEAARKDLAARATAVR